MEQSASCIQSSGLLLATQQNPWIEFANDSVQLNYRDWYICKLDSLSSSVAIMGAIIVGCWAGPEIAIGLIQIN